MKRDKWDPESAVAKGENPNGQTSVGVFGRVGPETGMGEQDWPSWGGDRDGAFGPYAKPIEPIMIGPLPRKRK